MDHASEASAVESTNVASSATISYIKADAAQPLSLLTKLLYGAPNLAGGAMIIPLLINMPKFYSDVVGVPLASLAVAIAVTRCLDAIIDPSIGLISDQTRSRWGRRRPYIFVGAPLAGLAFWGVLSPPAYLGGWGAVMWFTVTSMLCSFFLTIVLLPHYALGSELSLNYNERNSLFAAREAFGVLGTIIAAAAPGFLLHHFGWSDRMVFSRLGLSFMAGMIAFCWLMVAGVHERREFATRKSNQLVPGVRRALRNRPFKILLASYVAIGISIGVGPVLMPFFITYVIQPAQPALWLSIILVALLGIGFLFMPVGVVVARRFGKRRTLIGSYAVGVGIDLLIFLFVGKGNTTLYLILTSLYAPCYGVSLFLPPSMQAEVIDYDEFHTGRRREAQYVGFWTILYKFAAIPTAALPIALLASMGYVPNAAQAPGVILVIRMLFTILPAIARAASLAMVYLFPINSEDHIAILEGIEHHKLGQSATDPLTRLEIPPPAARRADEASGWFLDYFSPRELEDFLARGGQKITWDVRRAAMVSLGLCLITGYLAWWRIESSAGAGALASLAVVISGFTLSLFLFHLIRIRPAQRLAAGEIPDTVVRGHLEDCRSGHI